MQLKTLLSATPVRQVFGSVDRPVENIAYDSRRVQRHTMFVALRGEKTDGHQFIGHAIDKGASVIVAEREQKDPRVTCLVVENTRTALADFSAAFYGHPSRKLKLAAVTGTNGKTTTTFLIKHICENAGLRAGLIGTVRYEIGERILPAIRQRRLQSGSDGNLFSRAGAGAHTRYRMERRRLHEFDSGPSRFSRHHGKLLRSQGEAFHWARRPKTKDQTRGDCERRRPLRPTVARQA